MAMKKKWFTLMLCGLICLFITQQAGAQNVIEIDLDLSVTSMTPTYQAGHEGDTNYIDGFSATGNITYKGVPLGAYTWNVVLSEAPMDIMTLNSFNGYGFGGAFTVTGYGSCNLSGSGSAMPINAQGDMLATYTGQLSNCGGSLAGLVGLMAGNGQINPLSGTGASTFSFQIPK